MRFDKNLLNMTVDALLSDKMLDLPFTYQWYKSTLNNKGLALSDVQSFINESESLSDSDKANLLNYIKVV